MHLREEVITRQSSNYKEIDAFMKRVFPKEELMPMWLINILSKKKNHIFSAFYDNDLFVGIIYTIESDDMLFVFYIAVNDKIHSKGYGSQVLSILKEKYQDKLIALFIETLDPSADNYEQRVKRLDFYERNGFINTGVKVGTKAPFIDILSTDENITLAQCKKMVKFTPLKIFPPTTDENNN